MEPQTEQDLTDRLHPIHVVHEVSLPQVDGELREEELLLVSLKLGISKLSHLHCAKGGLTFPLGLAFLNTLQTERRAQVTLFEYLILLNKTVQEKSGNSETVRARHTSGIHFKLSEFLLF